MIFYEDVCILRHTVSHACTACATGVTGSYARKQEAEKVPHALVHNWEENSKVDCRSPPLSAG